MREVLFDTETTGLDPKEGHRVIELALVEVVDLMPTGRTFHSYFDPQRDVPLETTEVHGLTTEFLRGKPLFRNVVDDILGFICDAQMVAHNAAFDVGFLAAEFALAGRPPLANRFVDTVALAMRRFPAGANLSLDGLCRRFKIDRSARLKHDAMLDTQLLARVYLELNGGAHRSLAFETRPKSDVFTPAGRPFRPARDIGLPSDEEMAVHAGFVGGIKGNRWGS